MTAALLILAALIAGAGLLFLSQATVGVGLLALSCLIGIAARIAQSATQHSALHPAKSFTPDPSINYRTGETRIE